MRGARAGTPVEYVDNDTSASNGKHRSAYEKMLTDIRDGAVGAVVAWDLDRLHRRPIELEKFMAIADEKHLALATVSGDVDLSTAQGRLVARLKGSVAAHEGRAPEGPAATRRPAEGRTGRAELVEGVRLPRRTHQPDPATAPLVKQAYAAILAGASLGDVCRTWNTAGAYTRSGRPWTAETLTKFLRKPRNAGLRAYRGEIIGKGNLARSGG